MTEVDTEKGERIAKRLARAGVCSRRDAERLIADGRVAVDGKVLTTPATLVTDAAIITVDGAMVGAPQRTRVWRYHKERGTLTTNRDPQGRPTIFERLPPGLPRVISIGRLDFNSEGLLLLTNDGALARELELPATAWVRRYRVRAFGRVTPADVARLAKGITVSGIRYGAIEAQIDREQGDNVWLTMSLREGKNREVRKVLEALGLQVSRLIRTAYGPFQLGRLEPGEVEEVPGKVLTDQLGRNPNTAAGSGRKSGGQAGGKAAAGAPSAPRRAMDRTGDERRAGSPAGPPSRSEGPRPAKPWSKTPGPKGAEPKDPRPNTPRTGKPNADRRRKT